jgi:hypothetical protein
MLHELVHASLPKRLITPVTRRSFELPLKCRDQGLGPRKPMNKCKLTPKTHRLDSCASVGNISNTPAVQPRVSSVVNEHQSELRRAH